MCDTLVVVDRDRVLFAKNSDRDPNEAQAIEWHRGGTHAPGSRLRATWIEVEQAPRTYDVLLSRPFWMWGAEMGANEHGVVIGNEAVFTDQPYARAGGLTGMDLLRLALERAADAEAGVAVIVDLLGRYGQGGGCGHEDRSFTYHNSFIVADPRRAFVLETAGELWAVEEVTSGARSISNGLTIEPFASEHADRLRGAVASCRSRRSTTLRHGAGARGVVDLFAALRDHGGGPAPEYRAVNGAMSAPCMHAGGLLAASQTTASMVSELTGDDATHWLTGTSAPCTSVFVPLAVDSPVDLGPHPTDRYDGSTWWWRHENLHRAVVRDPARLLALYADERDAIEAAWTEARPDPAEAVAEAAARRRAWYATVAPRATGDVRPAYVRRYWAVRDRRARWPVAA
jgi:secernin